MPVASNNGGARGAGVPEANELLEDHIRGRAYFLWEKDSKPDGRANEYWARARAANPRCPDQ